MTRSPRKDTVVTKSSRQMGLPESIGSISWLTLFYDLIIVAVFARATYIYGKNPSWLTFAFICVSLLVLYVLWSVTTLELLLAPRETWLRRLVVFAQVCALVVAGLAMYRGGGISDRWGFVALTAAFLSIAVLILMRRRQPGSDHRHVVPLAIVALVTAGIFAIGACFPMGYTIAGGFLIAWIFYPLATIVAAVGFGIWGPRLTVSPAPFSAHALNERFGVLLLIVLGDAFLQLLEVLGALRTIPAPEFLVFTLLFVVGIWLLYFPVISNPPLAKTVGMARSRIAAHLVLVVSSAFGIVAYVELATGFSEHGETQTAWTALPVLGIVLAVGWLTLLQDGRWSARATVLAVAAALLLFLTVTADLADKLIRELDLVAANAIVLIASLVVLGLAGLLRPRPRGIPSDS